MSRDWNQFLGRLGSKARRAIGQVVHRGIEDTPSWYLIIVDEFEMEPEIRRCSSQDNLIKQMRKLPETCWAFPMFGVAARFEEVTEGQITFRYLRMPDGSLEPLFDTTKQPKPTDSYRVGPPPPDLDFDPTTVDFRRILPEVEGLAGEEIEEFVEEDPSEWVESTDELDMD